MTVRKGVTGRSSDGLGLVLACILRGTCLTIRLKTLIIVAITSAGLMGALYTTASLLLMREFIAIEQSTATENAERLRSALSDDIDGIDRSNGENWAFAASFTT